MGISCRKLKIAALAVALALLAVPGVLFEVAERSYNQLLHEERIQQDSKA
jgi:hypothetical protein